MREQLRISEVDHFDTDPLFAARVPFQQDILRLEVAMYDVLVMSILHCAKQLGQDLSNYGLIQEVPVQSDIEQLATLSVLRYNVIASLILVDVIYAYDIRVGECPKQLELCKKLMNLPFCDVPLL
jgi:hypothetical protein